MPGWRGALPRSEAERLQAAGETINAFVWLVAAVVMVFSAVSGADLLAAHGVQWGLGLAGGLAVDAALVVALIGDRQLHRYGERSGAGTVLRWTTAGMSLVLNCGQSLEQRQSVAVVLHALFPVLLIVLTEASQGYQLAFGRAVQRQQAVSTSVPEPAGTSVPTASAPSESAGTGNATATGTQAGATRTAGARTRRAARGTSKDCGKAAARSAAPWSQQQWADAVELVASYQDSHGRAPKLAEFHTALRMQRTAASPLRRAVLDAIAAHGLEAVRAHVDTDTSAAGAGTDVSLPAGTDDESAGTAPVLALHASEHRAADAGTAPSGTATDATGQ